MTVSGPQHGTLTFDASGRVATYTPAAGYVGPDNFTFKANDGLLDSNVATVAINYRARAAASPTHLWPRAARCKRQRPA